jgi:hypothetical protein
VAEEARSRLKRVAEALADKTAQDQAPE